ncbi:response regulator transcription factor [Kineosporia rhizophila]|uniref:response regulator transcription factor n=1 Tax=Kineosporia sp. NBRC 101677 TaxID=3032197 RepID=UPI001E385261|nr:response regulator transcription factor [Kineosporia sp. NBRC 101677]MCE0539730.1 response regulator transcription factor [Kineosporia rhizophila]GLY16374.1 DNA-binding response regulator [Kineosporia sp. NBRC 101677]
MQRVLVVEDDPVIADALRRRLEAEGFAVEVCHDGRVAVERFDDSVDLLVLDVMLPGLDGLEVCRRVQAQRPVPVLMLTARADETDRLIGLGVGADDYLTKPFSPRELVARVRALLRRVQRAEELARAKVSRSEQLDLGKGLMVDVGGRRVELSGQEVHLTRTEFDLLHALAQRPGRVVTREQMLAEVWAWPDPPTSGASRTVDSHVKTLRRKIGPERIRTVHGVGYALEPS